MRKTFTLVVLALLCLQAAFSQSKEDRKYKERAAEVQEEVWGLNVAAFSVTDIPAQYKNESAVIIAKSYEVTNSAKTRYKFGLFGGGFTKRLKYYTTLREKVKINDKSALEEYSTLEYKKNLNNTSRLLLRKIVETYKTFVGARIIKPDGRKVVINAEEEVLTKDEAKDKDGKLAIPDLQIGDILDYYVRIEEVTENGADTRGPDYFIMGGEYPMLYYNVRYILDKNCGADAIAVNGAKPMSKKINDDDDMVLEFTETNLSKAKEPMWSSAARQLPYYAIRYKYIQKYTYDTHFKQGQLNRGPYTNEYVKLLKDYLVSMIASKNQDNSAKSNLEDYFGGKKKLKEVPVDSVVNFLYNYYKWSDYGVFSSNDIDANNESFNYKGMSQFMRAYYMSEILFSLDIESEIVLVCSRYSNRLNEVVTLGDMDCLLQVHSGDKIKYVSFADFFNLYGELPGVYQGEESITLNREGKKNRGSFDESKGTLAVSPSSDNVLDEKLVVTFNPTNQQQIEIERTVDLKGSMKQSDQKFLLLTEDVDKRFSKLVNKPAQIEMMLDNKRSKARAGELQTAFEKERTKQKDYFKKEINRNFDQEPLELKKFEVVKDGLSLQEPAFVYKTTFTMDNFVKKAGPNFIFEVGKLMGTYSKIDSADRVRTMDVYMTAARTLNYTFSITIPQGYKANGVEALNKNVKNELAAFSSAAKLEGNTLTVTVKREYFHNFEPAANWPKLLEVMDAAADFTSSKVLLQKGK